MRKITLKKSSFAFFLTLVAVAIAATFVPSLPNFDDGKYNVADIAWILVATALVFLMTPALAFFYGGMVNRKNVLSTMMKSVVAAGVVGVLWIVVGYSLCFGDSIHGIIGNPLTHLFYKGVILRQALGGSAYNTEDFILYVPADVRHYHPRAGGWGHCGADEVLGVRAFHRSIQSAGLCSAGALELASGWFPRQDGRAGFCGWHGRAYFGGLCCTGRRAGAQNAVKVSYSTALETHPANIPYVLIGTGLLWFGWFGFNAGSALAANSLAVSAFATTNTAAAAAGLSWMFFDVLRGKKPSVVGFCVGAVVGLVAITPAAGFVAVPQSIFIGVVAAIISNLAVHFKATRTVLDDTLDVFPCHGLGGMVGMLMTGIFATKAVNAGGNDGWAYGNSSFFFIQLKAMAIAVGYSFTVSFLIFKLVNFIVPLRVSHAEEEEGLDASQHDEKYVQGTLLVATPEGLKEQEI